MNGTDDQLERSSSPGQRVHGCRTDGVIGPRRFGTDDPNAGFQAMSGQAASFGDISVGFSGHAIARRGSSKRRPLSADGV